MKKTLLTILLTAIVSMAVTSFWWASQDDGKCEFTTTKIVIPEVFATSEDGINFDTTYTYREP